MDGMHWIESLSDTFGYWLDFAIVAGGYAGLLAIVVVAINVLFRRWLSAGQMAFLWGLVLLRLMVPFAPSSSLSLANVVKLAESRVADVPLAVQPADVAEADPQHSIPDNVRQLTDLHLPTTAPDEMQELYWVEAVFLVMPLVWAVGGGAGLAYTVVNYARFCRRVGRVAECDDSRLERLWTQCCNKAGVKRGSRVVRFDGVEQPAIMGVLRPTLLLPVDGLDLDDAQLRMVMLHELAHVRRWDIAANWALVVIRAIHWWNPVYWLAASRFCSLREQACDAFVVRRMEEQGGQSYGALLLALAERRPNARAWRVMLPASILSFFPTMFRRHAVRGRLKALRLASAGQRYWHKATALALMVALVVCGFSIAREATETPENLANWMAKHPDVVLAPKRSYVVQEVYSGPQETREYDVAKVITHLAKEAGSTDKARESLQDTVKRLYFRRRSDGDGAIKSQPTKYGQDAVKGSPEATNGQSLLTCAIKGSTLSVTAPAALHESLRRMLEAWNENGLTQISVDTRFLSSNRDLVSDLGVSWQFLEAFSSDRESALPATGDDHGPVVHAESRVDEYLPLVVSTLSKEQADKLIEIAQGEPRVNVLSAPRITTFNGMEATIADCVQRPFVVGVFQVAAGANQPKVVVLEEGTTIRVRAVQGKKNVHLQASLEIKALGEVATASTSYRGSQVTIQVPSVNRRCIDVGTDLEDGQTLLVGSIPTGKQQQYSYYLLSARKVGE